MLRLRGYPALDACNHEWKKFSRLEILHTVQVEANYCTFWQVCELRNVSPRLRQDRNLVMLALSNLTVIPVGWQHFDQSVIIYIYIIFSISSRPGGLGKLNLWSNACWHFGSSLSLSRLNIYTCFWCTWIFRTRCWSLEERFCSFFLCHNRTAQTQTESYLYLDSYCIGCAAGNVFD